MAKRHHEFHADIGDTSLHVYQIDCVKGLSKKDIVPPESIDVIVTSPPYNLGVQYSQYDDNIKRPDYLDWLDRVAQQMKAALKQDGSLFLNISGKPSDQDVPFKVLTRMLDHFDLQNTIHWVKSIAIEMDEMNMEELHEDVVLGHYKPINSARFINDCHEYIFHLTKTGNVPLDRLSIGVPYRHKSNVKRWNSGVNGVHCRGNVWFIPYKTISNRKQHRPHPATFPPKLPEMCIQLHGVDRIDCVMDPFLGLGNTAIASMNLELDFIGFEIDPSYYDQAEYIICNHVGALIDRPDQKDV